MTMNPLSMAAAKWFEQRGISLDLVARLGVFTGLRRQNGDESEVVPDANGNIIVFPYVDGGRMVGAKY
ncbi:MAG: bifunctional DNA primase/helicase, partial [bacterium]